MKQKQSISRRKTVIIAGILIIAIVLYIFGIRPGQVKADCNKKALNGAAYDFKLEDGGVNYNVEKNPATNGYSVKNYEQLYTMCIRDHGL